jgi:hypothetical protein
VSVLPVPPHPSTRKPGDHGSRPLVLPVRVVLRGGDARLGGSSVCLVTSTSPLTKRRMIRFEHEAL